MVWTLKETARKQIHGMRTREKAKEWKTQRKVDGWMDEDGV
jgi:hypothetical protein